MAKQLRTGEVDLCFASQPLPGPDLRTRNLLIEDVLLGVPPGHRIAGRKRARLEDVSGEPFVTTRPAIGHVSSLTGCSPGPDYDPSTSARATSPAPPGT